MVLNEEKRAKLDGILTHRQGISGGAGTSSPHALAFATVATSPTSSTPAVAVPFTAAQASPTPFSCEKVVEIESDEDSAEGPISKRLRPTTTTASHSSTAGCSASPRDRTPSAPSFPDLFDGGTSAFVTPPALELPTVLQHALKGFQLEVTVDSDEASTFTSAQMLIKCGYFTFTNAAIEPHLISTHS